MGYTTDFTGHWTVSPALSPSAAAKLKVVTDTRRMWRKVPEIKAVVKKALIKDCRNLSLLFARFLAEKHSVSLPVVTKMICDYLFVWREEEIFNNCIGFEGEFYSCEHLAGFSGLPGLPPNCTKQFKQCACFVRDNNTPPRSQPSLWCDWQYIWDEDTHVGKIQWSGMEKFYNYVEWLRYLIKKIFREEGVRLNGTVKWQGEYEEDIGKIVVEDNVVTVYEGEEHKPIGVYEKVEGDPMKMYGGRRWMKDATEEEKEDIVLH
eukprot:TRINITY_DN115175_c0_g1_i1.p1 TRINITY_DN115175_c0_g1~~TRINITY_DN115175_c0_g1_i1.p1  ORF type:complete len:262 (+),score=36.42 TRINITY_DN115175_c0_g1_i1:43-828(+)